MRQRSTVRGMLTHSPRSASCFCWDALAHHKPRQLRSARVDGMTNVCYTVRCVDAHGALFPLSGVRYRGLHVHQRGRTARVHIPQIMTIHTQPASGSGSNTSRPAPPPDTGSLLLDWLSEAATFLLHVERRFDPFVRPAIDALLRDPTTRLVTALINRKRPDEGLRIAEERPIPDEDAHLASIISSFEKQMRLLWKPGGFERGGNTKTHGIVRGEFIVHDSLPTELRHGVFAQPRTYRAWVRFSGPGPYVTPDIDDVGFMSISVKLIGVPGPKLMDEEQFTQDMLGVSVPTFVTPDTKANAQLQIESLKNAQMYYFINLRQPHVLDLIMQSPVAQDAEQPVRSPLFQLCAVLARGRPGDAVLVLAEVQEANADTGSATPPTRRLSPGRDGRLTRRGRHRVRGPTAAADRSAPDADREQRRALARDAFASAPCRDVAPSTTELCVSRADGIRQTSVLQPLAFHSRASAARQSEPRPTPDVSGALQAAAHDERRASLRADRRRDLRLTRSARTRGPAMPQGARPTPTRGALTCVDSAPFRP